VLLGHVRHALQYGSDKIYKEGFIVHVECNSIASFQEV